MDGPQSIEAILAELRDPDERVRQAAFKLLRSRIQRDRLDDDSICNVLAAAPGPWPYRIDTNSGDEAILGCFYDVELSHSAARTLADSFPVHGPRGRYIVLNLLGRGKSGNNLDWYLEAIRRHARTGEMTELASHVVHTSEPSVVAKLFPELLRYLDVEILQFEICHMAFDAVRRGGLSAETLTPHAPEFLRIVGSLREAMTPLQNHDGQRWMWEEAYEQQRNLAGLLLDLSADLPAELVIPELKQWLGMKDPRPLVFAVLSLLRLGQPVEPEVFHRCARFPELRQSFFEHLREMGLQHYFPAEFYTQLHFAEADMVRWLTYPTELDTVPDEIVATQVLRYRQDGFRPVGLYVFRFRTDEPHWSAKDGWMAGISGPFPLDGLPSTKADGATFSDFKPWESRSAVDHAKEIAGITIGDLPEFEVLEPGEETK